MSDTGLLAALSRVADPRKRRGVRHSITTVLAVAVCAVLAGCRSFAAISEWAANASDQVLAALQVHGVPSESCIRRTLQRVDGDELDTTIGAWASARTEPAGGRRRAVAVDGKTVRGSGSDSVNARHLMAAIDHDAGVVLGQVDVAAKTNEIPMVSQLLDRLDDIEGVVVTADALHAQRAHADYLVLERQADYLLSVKGNQPGLFSQLKALPWKDVPLAHRSTNRGHGRIEQRTIKVVTIRTGIVFPHARQAIQVTRKSRPIKARSKKWTRTETVYAVTSLGADQATPAELASWIRGHWTIENRLHWVRDCRSTRIARRSVPAPGPAPWPPSGTWSSACCASAASPTSPKAFDIMPGTPSAPSHSYSPAEMRLCRGPARARDRPATPETQHVHNNDRTRARSGRPVTGTKDRG